MISYLAQQNDTLNQLYRRFITQTPYLDVNTVVDRISGAAHSSLFRPLDYCIFYTLPCFAGSNAIPTFQKRKIALFNAFKASSSNQMKAAHEFKTSFTARAKTCDRFNTHDTSRLMRLYIEKECKKEGCSDDVKKRIISALGINPVITPTTTTISLIAASALVYHALPNTPTIISGGEDTSSNTSLYIPIVIVVALLVGGAFFFKSKRFSPPPAESSDHPPPINSMPTSPHESSNLHQQQQGQLPDGAPTEPQHTNSDPEAGIITTSNSTTKLLKPIAKHAEGVAPASAVTPGAHSNESGSTPSDWQVVSAVPTPTTQGGGGTGAQSSNTKGAGGTGAQSSNTPNNGAAVDRDSSSDDTGNSGRSSRNSTPRSDGKK